LGEEGSTVKMEKTARGKGEPETAQRKENLGLF